MLKLVMLKKKEYGKQYKQAEEAWSEEDQMIKGEIARFIAVRSINRTELARLMMMKPTTFYSRCKNPCTFTLEEHRRLKHILEKY